MLLACTNLAGITTELRHFHKLPTPVEAADDTALAAGIRAALRRYCAILLMGLATFGERSRVRLHDWEVYCCPGTSATLAVTVQDANLRRTRSFRAASILRDKCMGWRSRWL